MPPSERAKANIVDSSQPFNTDRSSVDCRRSADADGKHDIETPVSAQLESRIIHQLPLLPMGTASQAMQKRGSQEGGSKTDSEPTELPVTTLSHNQKRDNEADSAMNGSSGLSTEESEGHYSPRGQDDPVSPPFSDSSTVEETAVDWGKYFKIQPSELGGLGAFAVRELRLGETILVEEPLLRTTHFRLMPDYYNLSEAAKKAYLALHGADDGDAFSRVERIKNRNSFSVPGGIAIFELASRFNHACPPARNVQYRFDTQRGVLSLTICHEVVPAGTELRLNYGGSPADLYATYGFRCECGGCTPLTDEDLQRLRDQEFGVFTDW